MIDSRADPLYVPPLLTGTRTPAANERAFFTRDLMNEPRYARRSDEENVEGATPRAQVDEGGTFAKEIDPQPPARRPDPAPVP